MNLNEQNIKNVIKRDFQSKNPFKQGLNMPKLKSITLHISFKEQKFESKKYLLPAIIGLQIITGQKVKRERRYSSSHLTTLTVQITKSQKSG